MSGKPDDSILVINSGSSSIKFQLFKPPHLHLLAKGKIANINHAPLFTVMITSASDDEPLKTEIKLPEQYTYKDAMSYILNWIKTDAPHSQINIVAHRVVHGGDYFTKSVRVTPEVISKLKTLSPLAPLHQPQNLSAIEMLAELKPHITQVACFDTAFHTGHTRLFTEYALPESIREKGVRRYGFHGLSYEWIAHRLQQDEPELLKGRIIGAHLGNGASLCAIKKGLSIDTTMGLTALDGLPMGTRCGSLDPGSIIHMIREFDLSVDEVEKMLYYESGLKGLSNWTHDVRVLQQSEHPAAKFALDYFCIKAAQYMAMMAVSLGGIDAIVFTGGIGENSAFIRDDIVRRLDFLKPFKIRIIKANEEKIMALHAMEILKDE